MYIYITSVTFVLSLLPDDVDLMLFYFHIEQRKIGTYPDGAGDCVIYFAQTVNQGEIMGRFTNHVQNTIGGDAANQADKEATAAFDEYVALCGEMLDTASGDSAFKARENAFRLLENARAGILPTMNGAVQTASVAAGALGAGTNGSGQLSEKEQLGELALKAGNGDIQLAAKNIDQAARINAAPQGVQQMIAQLLDDVTGTKPGDSIVQYRGSWMRKSDADMRDQLLTVAQDAMTFTNAFHDIAEAVLGNLPVQDVKKTVAEVKAKLKGNAKDNFLAAVENATNVKPNVGETFENYMTRVVMEINKAALGTNSSAITNLLDEIGKTVNMPRNAGQTNDDYKKLLVSRLDADGVDANSYRALWSKLSSMTNTMGVKFDKNRDSAADVIERMVNTRRVSKYEF